MRASNKRIVKNTFMLYFRMMISMIVSLFTTRVILSSLGVEDYGVYNVVGGGVTSLSIFTTALAVSISRFITYSLGKEDITEQKQIFSTSIFIQLIVVAAVFVIAESVGLWFLNAKLVIPEERYFAANWVYQLSLLSFIFTIIGIPYNAVITAHEKMSVYATIGLLDTFAKLLIAYTINKSPIDHLIWYSALLMLSSVMIQLFYIVYSIKNFKECRCGLRPNRDKFKEMLGFSGWSVLGGIAPVARDQGGTIIINMFFGPVVNAARGVANQVCMTINSFVINFQSAVNPQIIKNYAAHDYNNLRQLVFASSKYSCFILLIFAIPVAINLPFILRLWLVEYPIHTESFVLLVLVFNIFEAMSNPLMTAAVAIGQMKSYQLRVAPIIIMNLPISYVFLSYGCEPEIVFIVSIFISFSCLIVRLKFLSAYISISMIDFLKKVLLRVFVITIIAFTFSNFINHLFSISFISFIIISCISVTVTAITIVSVGCTKSEREIIISYIKKRIKVV